MAPGIATPQRSLPPSRSPLPLGIILCVLLMTSTVMALRPFMEGNAVRAASSSFVFTAAGDYAQTTATTATLQAIAHSGAKFHLALGDIDESKGVAPAQWSSYVKSLLPTNFPFEIIPGNHDRGQLSTYTADLPDHLNSTGTYGQQYAFDYPSQSPLARVIMISPGQTSSNYNQGGAGYTWVSSTIDAARAATIPWVIVGMYENCFSLGSPHCSNDALLNLLVSKKVDLILYAHKHNYEASKQLAFNGTTCTSLTTVSYNANCVVNATSKMTKGAGSVIAITGTGGAPLIRISTIDPASGYFRTWEAANRNATWGISRFTVSASRLTMKFVGTSGGSFTDSFTIAG